MVTSVFLLTGCEYEIEQSKQENGDIAKLYIVSYDGETDLKEISIYMANNDNYNSINNCSKRCADAWNICARDNEEIKSSLINEDIVSHFIGNYILEGVYTFIFVVLLIFLIILLVRRKKEILKSKVLR